MFSPKRTHIHALLITLVLTIAGCSKDSDDNPGTSDLPMSSAYISDSTIANNMTVYNIVYPSTDPYGKPVMLSGTISFGEAVKETKQAKGLLLYNHFTIYCADQCPSRGSLDAEQYTAYLELITVSPDYYGFGVTEHHHQAYCLSEINAQASVDALLAAKEILARKGFTMGDLLLNAGYSQGGQTTMGVVRLVAEKYPDIHLTYSFAGAGAYDISETYRQFITATIAGMPSTVVSVLLSYNEFRNVGATRDEMFIEPVLSHINDWILSKRYTRQQIDSLIGSLAIDQYMSPTLLDTTTSLSKRFFKVFLSDNLCHGWDASRSGNIMLFHNTKDITVPVANTVNMYNFLIAGGATDVVLDTANYGGGGEGEEPAHEKAAIRFVLKALDKLGSYLND
ncbi:MAG: lipase family protein [bacterium]